MQITHRKGHSTSFVNRERHVISTKNTPEWLKWNKEERTPMGVEQLTLPHYWGHVHRSTALKNC